MSKSSLRPVPVMPVNAVPGNPVAVFVTDKEDNKLLYGIFHGENINQEVKNFRQIYDWLDIKLTEKPVFTQYAGYSLTGK